MAETSEGAIFQALMDRVTVLADAINLPVAWPNVDYDPPADQKYLRIVYAPNQVIRMGIPSDMPHRRTGLLQISVQWPKGGGELALREVVGQVAAYFSADLKLTKDAVTVRITQDAEPRDMLIEDARVQVPVMVHWESYI